MQARIFSLGDIVTPNIPLIIGALIALIVTKYPELKGKEGAIQAALGKVLASKFAFIEEFKHGKVEENSFDEQMTAAIIAAIKEAMTLDIEISIAEFNTVWNKMCPVYKQFADNLNELITFNAQKGNKVVFISATNPKDMRHLRGELDDNKIPYKLDGEFLIEIAGIKLVTTYTTQKNKAELIKNEIRELRQNPLVKSALAASMNEILSSSSEAASTPAIQIKYIHAANNVKELSDPILTVIREDIDKNIDALEKQAIALSVEVDIWKKLEKQPLSAVLNATPAQKSELAAAAGL